MQRCEELPDAGEDEVIPCFTLLEGEGCIPDAFRRTQSINLSWKVEHDSLVCHHCKQQQKGEGLVRQRTEKKVSCDPNLWQVQPPSEEVGKQVVKLSVGTGYTSMHCKFATNARNKISKCTEAAAEAASLKNASLQSP